MGFFKNIINSFVKMSRPIFSFAAHNNNLVFKLPTDEFYSYTLGIFDIKTRHDPYILDAYTLKTNDINLEYIHLDDMTTWNGLSRSLYENFIKEKLKIKTMDLLERKEIEHYELSTYKLDNKFIIHIIFIWEISKDIFIIDTKGKLFEGLLSSLEKDYIYLYNDEKYLTINSDISIVKANSLNEFFNASN